MYNLKEGFKFRKIQVKKNFNRLSYLKVFLSWSETGKTMGEGFAIKLRAAYKLGTNIFLGIGIIQVLLTLIVDEKAN
jgi:hypothetical protein